MANYQCWTKNLPYHYYDAFKSNLEEQRMDSRKVLLKKDIDIARWDYFDQESAMWGISLDFNKNIE